MGWERALSLLPYGKHFHFHRRILQTYFGRQECLAFQPITHQESIAMVKKLIHDPQDYDSILELWVYFPELCNYSHVIDIRRVSSLKSRTDMR